MDILLNKQPWYVKGYWPWVPIWGKSMETGKDLMGITEWIPAVVPGGIHYDLYRAGWIENPYMEMNSLKCEWVENRWWLYKTSFPSPEETGEKVELVFKGLDYQATIYLNGTCLGEHEGMYEPAVFDVTSIAKAGQELELMVLLKNVPQEMAQIGKTSLTRTQKSRFNYKWDFATRLVNVGIWDDVLLRVHQAYSLGEISLNSDVVDGVGKIDLTAQFLKNTKAALNNPEITLQLECFDPEENKLASQSLSLPEQQERLHLSLDIPGPRLWYPNGYGEQPLYRVVVSLRRERDVLDERSFLTGIRSLEYVRNEGSPEDALPYTFVINGERIYVQGANITPLDHLYGNVTPAHYEWMIYLMKKANMNMIRVWGGGIIEKETFYELCDRYGILVWQEFIQSSSGIDNIPSKIPEFLGLLKKTAIAALKERRNHVSLAVWSGGNELMEASNRPSGYEDENLAMLKGLVEEYDPQRLFLPTSASGPVEFVTEKKGISHDVHGHWNYQGNPRHYELYSNVDNLFHSEFGVDGVSSVNSLKKFLKSENLKPVSMAENPVWRHHGEWWDTLERDKGFFGDFSSLTQFSRCSQWIQAEGLRFILEANRRRQFVNSGSIIWQMNEPWPNASCTCLMEYFGRSKMAYHWVTKAFAPIHASLDYRRLDYQPGEIFKAGVYLDGVRETGELNVIARVMDRKGRMLKEENWLGRIKQGRSLEVGRLQFDVTTDFGDLFFVLLQVEQEGSIRFDNLYIFSTLKERIYVPALDLKGNLSVTALSDWVPTQKGMTRTYRVRNVGEELALHIHPEEITDAYWMLGQGSFEALFPGEERDITVYCTSKAGGGFLQEDQKDLQGATVLPKIKFRHFTSEVDI